MAERDEGQRPPFNFRTRLGAFQYSGMIPDGNPGNLLEYQPRLLINAELDAGDIKVRGGQSLALTAPASIFGIAPFPIPTKRSLFILTVGCMGENIGLGFAATVTDPEQSPEYQAATWYDTGGTGLAAAPYGSDLYFGQDANLRLYRRVEVPYGRDALSIGGSSQDRPVLTYDNTVSAMASFDGLLLSALSNGASSYIRSWDGLTDKLDVGSLPAAVTRMKPYRETLVAGFNSGTGTIRYRVIGSSPGTWASLSAPAGTGNMLHAVSYKDALYWTTGTDYIYSLSGTTITQILAATTGIGAGAITYGIDVVDGVLVLAYGQGSAAKLATFDGTTWTGTAKNLTSDSGMSALTAAETIRWYRDRLYACVKTGASLYGIRRSPVGAITGTWETLIAVGSTGQVVDMLVY